MMFRKFLLILLADLCLASISSNASGQMHDWFSHRIKTAPPLRNRRLPVEKYFEQPVDHCNEADTRRWQQLYYENLDNLVEGGPIIIFIGGEFEINGFWAQYGIGVHIAEKYSGAVFEVENRYYGKSRPTPTATVEDLKYNTVKQVLADLANFITAMKKENPKLAKSKVFTVGGSYPGALSAWMRMEYPNLVDGALASSAVVNQGVDYDGYLQVVTTAIRERGSQKCIDKFRSAFSQFQQLFQRKKFDEIQKIFSICAPLDRESIFLLMDGMVEHLSGLVQRGIEKIQKFCEDFTASTITPDLNALANIWYSPGDGTGCHEVSYEKFLDYNRNNLYDPARIWFYQQCYEMGGFKTTSSCKQVFGNLARVGNSLRWCRALFGDNFRSHLIWKRNRQLIYRYKKKLLKASRIIFTHGEIDPWRKAGVEVQVNDQCPVIIMKDAGHCHDLNVADSGPVYDAQQQTLLLIEKWLKT